MTPTSGLILIQALVVLALVLRLRRQSRYLKALKPEHQRVQRELERLEWIYLGKRPWVKGWL